MASFFYPAIALTRRLRYAHKFTLLGLLTLTAIGLLQIGLYNALDRVIEPSRAELRGLDAVMRLSRSIQLVQQHRGLSAGLLGGNVGLQQKQASKTRAVEQAFETLTVVLPAQVQTSKRWQEVMADWQAIRQNGLSLPLISNTFSHDQIIAKMLVLMTDAADATALTLDPAFDSYYLMDTLVNLPGFTEQLGQTRAYGAGILAKKSLSDAEKIHMAELLGRVQITRAQHKNNLNKVLMYNREIRDPVIRADQSFETDMLALIEVVRAEIIGAHFGVSSDKYIELSTALIDEAYTIGDEILIPALRSSIETRIAGARKNLLLNIALSVMVAALFAYLMIGTFLALTRQIQQALKGLRRMVGESTNRAVLVESIAAGDLSQDLHDSAESAESAELTWLDIEHQADQRDEIGALVAALGEMHTAQQVLGRSFVRMTQTLRLHRNDERLQDWFKSGINMLNLELRGDRTLEDLTKAVIALVTPHVQGAAGALYLAEEHESGHELQLQMAASYAFTPEQLPRARIALGEGLAGEVARTKKALTLSSVPAGYMTISSALGQATPASVVAVPLLHDGKLKGLIEIGGFQNFSAAQLDWLEHAAEAIAIAIDVVQARRRVNELLEQTQQQTEELRVQQEELQQSNEELEERANLLEQQREVIRAKNQEVEASSLQLQRKAEELERISTYKSEFLANMSHELRTPLNSMLILSSLLQQNKAGQLSDKQVEYAATIYGAGKDLLNLINDILDLSKIEAGQLDLHVEDLAVIRLVDELTALFQPLAEQQKLSFKLHIQDGVPAVLRADAQRTLQILKNLLSNAFKFTAKGEVSLSIQMPQPGANPLAVAALSFVVSDSGIGIAADKQDQIFHAFQQADGSTSRKYGGTGLGLSISRQLAQRMGGRIELLSEPGRGSTFTLTLPLDASRASMAVPIAAAPAHPLPAPMPAPTLAPTLETASAGNSELPAAVIEDDRDRVRAGIATGERVILVVEDDLTFASLLRDTVREHGFHAIVATDGESGLALTESYTPNAIILDVMLPHIDGWGVMRSIKDNPRTRHIPVHFITCLEDRQKALNMGAVGFLTKPVNAEQLGEVFKLIRSAIDQTAKKLLVVEDNEAEAKSVAALLEMSGLEIVIAHTGKDALERLRQEKFDCMVLDLGLADMSGFDLLEHLKRQGNGAQIPVIVHSGRRLSSEDERRLRQYSDSIIIKGAKSPERLLNEVSLFLHMVETSLPQEKQNMIRRALDKEAMFERRKVLLVDDDMRNIFSLSSVLSDKGMQIVEATNGREALAELEAHPDVDIILMDIMMPEMDGYEAMRQIRKNPRFARLPIIAVTAKAMVTDQKLCLEAGASDYIAKPVDLDKLFSLMRVWLYQGAQGAQSGQGGAT
ncbi:MAG: response regulator [Pseudomonadota bacterium]